MQVVHHCSSSNYAKDQAICHGKLFATKCTGQLFGFIQSYEGELSNSRSFSLVHLIHCLRLSVYICLHVPLEHCQQYIVNFRTTISMYYQNLETVRSSKLVKYVFQGNLNPYTFLCSNSRYVAKCKAFTLPSLHVCQMDFPVPSYLPVTFINLCTCLNVALPSFFKIMVPRLMKEGFSS